MDSAMKARASSAEPGHARRHAAAVLLGPGFHRWSVSQRPPYPAVRPYCRRRSTTPPGHEGSTSPIGAGVALVDSGLTVELLQDIATSTGIDALARAVAC